MKKPSKRWILAIGLGAAIVVVIAAIVVLLVVFLDDEDSSSDFQLTLTPPSKSPLGNYKNASVSTESAGCSEIARDLMLKGGNVVDAAIGGLLCMGVVHPHSLGIGGGFFLVLYNATTKETKVLNARETAPGNATQDMFEQYPENSTRGGLAVAVPGEIKGYWDLHELHGHLNWTEVLQPTINLCKDGIRITSSLARAIAVSRDAILEEESLKEIFYNYRAGRLFVEGEIMTRPKLAETLEILASEGGNAFYEGELAERIIADLTEFGGIMTVDDLNSYKIEWSDPIDLDIFPNFKLKSIRPPGSGILLGFMLRVLGDYLPRPTSISSYALVYQRILEAFKFTYAQRSALGDPNDPEVTEEVEATVSRLLSMDFAQDIRSRMKDDSTSQNAKDYDAVFDFLPEDSGTAHLSIVAPNGDAIAATTTVNHYFGAKIRSRSTGIIYNNEMDDFSSPSQVNGFDLPAAPNNYIRPGKRPMSSMCPTIITDSDGIVRLVIGAAGGTKITTSVALVSINNLWFNMNIKEAMDESRIHHQLSPMEATTEPLFNEEMLEILRNIGHKLDYHAITSSIVSAVARLENGTLQANYDYRKAGSIAGF